MASCFIQELRACSPSVPIEKLQGVLYKPENIHGGRGPTFLVQNVLERTGKKTLEIRDAKCKVISKFGLWATDFPYGARYYTKVGKGSKHTAIEINKRAKKGVIYIQGKNRRWIRVKSALKRAGDVYSP